MATSSISENILINNKKSAKALIDAIEASQREVSDVACKIHKTSPTSARIATREDIKHIHEMRMRLIKQNT